MKNKKKQKYFKDRDLMFQAKDWSNNLIHFESALSRLANKYCIGGIAVQSDRFYFIQRKLSDVIIKKAK